jgi:DNA mismatch repair ATPase MutS
MNPSVILAPSASDVRLLEKLSLDPVSERPEHFMVQLVKPSEATTEASRRALSFLRTADCPPDLPNEDLGSFHYTKLPEDGEMLRAVGVLLAACARAGGTVGVLRIVLHAVGKNLVIDSCALNSLSIFKRHLHPSAYGGRAKEGLSLFALMNRTKSKVGERKLRMWFAAPSNDKAVLDERLDAVSFFVGSASTDLFTHVRESLSGCKDVARCISRIRTG